ncbi:IucC family-domain-containing protein [Aspergillus parasiticus]|uniref:IucC family-domain-containing protein n=1 Tax=Aspergillus parasiticus TaxID=5067 RepID=A0A5N6D937_ASPPA|nr:IucC family-domain-containing protein [Aspergillus parasiticus]
MAVVGDYQVKAKAETTKRLIAQLVNEGLATPTLCPDTKSPGVTEGRITPECDESRCIKTEVAQGNGCIWRPKDFKVPVTICTEGVEVEEDNPGKIFEFISINFACNVETREAIARELRNSADMLAKWMEIAAEKPLLDLNSSFIDWEQALITGHPSHPASLCGPFPQFHRTCYADKLLKPVGPDDLPDMLNPGLSFVILPRSSVRVFGPFEDLLRPLGELLEVDISTIEDKIIVPCLSQHLPSLQNFFPEAEIVASVPHCAQAQASIRTVSVPGYGFDIKFSLVCLITSALRVLPCWSAAAAPNITSVLKRLFPPDLWVFGDVAAVTGSQENLSEARHLTCILRENMEAKANGRDETLILASALMEKPFGRDTTYAEILFNLTTVERKSKWFQSYVHQLLQLALDPLLRHGIGCEFHGQNTVVRVHRKTKAIMGFAIRNAAGIKLHRPSLERQGFDTTKFSELCSDELHVVWDRVHHALLQNNIGFMLDALDLERSHNGWAIVRSEISSILQSGDNPIGKEVYRYFCREMMPFKSFIRMRINACFSSSMKLVEREVPNVLYQKSPWFLQLFLSGTKSLELPVLPNEVGSEMRALEREAVEESLITCVGPYGELPPVFQEALAIALNNIVERWWKDEEANFPNRMPLEPQAEDLHRWIDHATDVGIMRPYAGHQGNLRPDILIPAQTEGKGPEFRVCEINGRFPISLISHVACVYEALAGCLRDSPVFEPATRYEKVQEGLLALFDPNLPIHFVSEGKDFPRTSPLFGLYEKRTGMRPRQVKSKDLRLVPSKASRTGFILCCVWGADPDVSRTSEMPQLIKVNGEALEEVHQIGLQLFDYELFHLPLEMVRHIGLCCVNDPRSVFIAHDKRILGIILQELDALLNKHKVLSPAQAQILREMIIPTILPGSSEFKALLEGSQKDPRTKNGYILKPVRDARGNGILLGKNISVHEWETILASLDSQAAKNSVPQYMIQHLLPLRSFDWFWDEQRKARESRMVGTYFSVNGRFVGLGMWRTASASEDVIAASTKDATALLSVVPVDQ